MLTLLQWTSTPNCPSQFLLFLFCSPDLPIGLPKFACPELLFPNRPTFAGKMIILRLTRPSSLCTWGWCGQSVLEAAPVLMRGGQARHHLHAQSKCVCVGGNGVGMINAGGHVNGLRVQLASGGSQWAQTHGGWGVGGGSKPLLD